MEDFRPRASQALQAPWRAQARTQVTWELRGHWADLTTASRSQTAKTGRSRGPGIRPGRHWAVRREAVPGFLAPGAPATQSSPWGACLLTFPQSVASLPPCTSRPNSGHTFQYLQVTREGTPFCPDTSVPQPQGSVEGEWAGNPMPVGATGCSVKWRGTPGSTRSCRRSSSWGEGGRPNSCPIRPGTLFRESTFAGVSQLS